MDRDLHFMSAVLDGDLITVESLISKGVSVDTEGGAAMYHACLKGQAGMVSLLINNGANLSDNAKDLLCAAAFNNHDAIVASLIKEGITKWIPESDINYIASWTSQYGFYCVTDVINGRRLY